MKTRSRRRQASAVFASPRTSKLLQDPVQLSSEVLAKKKYKLNGLSVDGKHASVDFATRSPCSRYAIKNQFITSPGNASDRAYREVRILEQLSKLKEKTEYYPMKETNFVNFVEWFKAKDEETEEPMIHYVLECADKTLGEYKELTYYQWKAVLFQIFFALHVAQKEYEFVHNDLHFKNILIVEPSSPDEYFEFRDGKNRWYLTGLFVKITDFGLSRIRLDDQRIIYNKKRPETQAFSPNADVEQVMTEMMKIKINPSSWLCPNELRKLKGLDEQEEKERREEMVKEKRKEITALSRKVAKMASLEEILRSPLWGDLKEKKEEYKTPAVVKKRRVVLSDQQTPNTNRRLSLAVSKIEKMEIPRFQLSDENHVKGDGIELYSSGEFASPSKLKRQRTTKENEITSKKFKVISKEDILKERNPNISFPVPPINIQVISPDGASSKVFACPVPVVNVVPPQPQHPSSMKEVDLKTSQKISKVQSHPSMTTRRENREKIFEVFFNT